MPRDWEFWLDAQLSPAIAKWLSEDFGRTVKSSYTLQFSSTSDKEIFRRAKEAGRVILVTKDFDFAELLNQHGPPPKILLLRLGNMDNRLLYRLLKHSIEQHIRLLIDFDQPLLEFRPILP